MLQLRSLYSFVYNGSDYVLNPARPRRDRTLVLALPCDKFPPSETAVGLQVGSLIKTREEPIAHGSPISEFVGKMRGQHV